MALGAVLGKIGDFISKGVEKGSAINKKSGGTIGSALSGLAGKLFNGKKSSDPKSTATEAVKTVNNSGGFLSKSIGSAVNNALSGKLLTQQQKETMSQSKTQLQNIGGGFSFGQQSQSNLFLPFALVLGVVIIIIAVFRK